MASLLGAIVGGVLVLVGNAFQLRRQRLHRLLDLRLDAYSEWLAGMEARLASYATQSLRESDEHRVELCEKRLILLEQDERVRCLIRDVWAAFPRIGTDEYEDLRREFTQPESDWQPFRASMDALQTHVRESLG